MTTLRPCYETTLTHGSDAVVLRASLRAAVNIDSLDGGFPAVQDRLTEGHLTTTHAVIRASATDRQQAERLLSNLDRHPLRPFLDKAQPACLGLLAHILPTPEAAESRTTTPTTTSTITPKPWAEHFADLYGYATGWLAWTPEVVWNASCDELTAAFTARVDHLVAMNGGSSNEEPDDTPAKQAQRQANIEAGLDPDFDRNALRALKSKMS